MSSFMGLQDLPCNYVCFFILLWTWWLIQELNLIFSKRISSIIIWINQRLTKPANPKEKEKFTTNWEQNLYYECAVKCILLLKTKVKLRNYQLQDKFIEERQWILNSFKLRFKTRTHMIYTYTRVCKYGMYPKH